MLLAPWKPSDCSRADCRQLALPLPLIPELLLALRLLQASRIARFGLQTATSLLVFSVAPHTQVLMSATRYRTLQLAAAASCHGTQASATQRA